MTGESDNLPMGGTDNAHPLSLDDAANLDWTDPGEDTGTDDDEPQSDEETVEADDEGQETDETTVDDDDADEDGQSDDEPETGDDSEADDEAEPIAAEVKDDQVITLPNGESVTFGEAKAGYLRQADYSRKTQELGNKRRDLEALATNVQSAVTAIADHLQKALPQPPDPNLAITDPNKYTRMKAVHDHAMAQLAAVVEAAHAPKQAMNQLTEQQHKELVASESAKLAEAFPQVRTQEGYKSFFDKTSETAKQLGYSDEEIAQAVDHRLFKLAHYARLGMQAEAAKAKARDKVKNAPPVAQPKRAKGKNAVVAKRNADAMRRLEKTGSIHDAMSIDFD